MLWRRISWGLLGVRKGDVSHLCIVNHEWTLTICSVKLLSGTLTHENEGNQFGHAAPIFTTTFLVITAVLQIICLNRGLKVYDSTLVVPVFYGVYTATGYVSLLNDIIAWLIVPIHHRFLNSLVGLLLSSGMSFA